MPSANIRSQATSTCSIAKAVFIASVRSCLVVQFRPTGNRSGQYSPRQILPTRPVPADVVRTLDRTIGFRTRSMQLFVQKLLPERYLSTRKCCRTVRDMTTNRACPNHTFSGLPKTGSIIPVGYCGLSLACDATVPGFVAQQS